MLGDEFHVDRQVRRWCSGLMFRELRLGLGLGTGADFGGRQVSGGRRAIVPPSPAPPPVVEY